MGLKYLNRVTVRRSIYISPVRMLALSFLLIIPAGAILLVLPLASADGMSMGWFDALFTATSAVCVTGLLVVDIGTQLSLFGQTVVLCLIQAGGLGLMTISTLVFLLMGKRITLRERLLMKEALNQFKLEGVVRLTKYILTVTFVIESIGALLLALRFVPLFGWSKGVYYSIFHSISAFCNAGIDLLGHYTSFMEYTGDLIINLVTMALVFLGGLGFTVILDLNNHGYRFRKWALHTKIVITVSLALIVLGFLFFFLAEYGNPHTIGSLAMKEKLLASLFLSVNVRTAGIYTIDAAELTNASKFMTILLMFIGASPTSTGGGIKTTTMSLILLMAWSVAKGQNDIVVFRRRIPYSIAHRALAIALISLLAWVAVTLVLSFIEFVPFLDIMFEAAAAVSTTGLSVMDIAGMHYISRIILMMTMYLGRVGPLSLTLALARRQKQDGNHIRYPEERIMVG